MPTIKTVLFQGISDEGVDFLLRSKEGQQGELEAALCYVHGFPPVAGQLISQWRLEGRAVPIAVESIVHGAPSAQILASTGAKGPVAGEKSGSRVLLKDRTEFVNSVEILKKQLSEGTIAINELEKQLKVYRLQPRRAELSVSGPIWERFEWRMGEGGVWEPCQRLIPY